MNKWTNVFGWSFVGLKTEYPNLIPIYGFEPHVSHENCHLGSIPYFYILLRRRYSSMLRDIHIFMEIQPRHWDMMTCFFSTMEVGLMEKIERKQNQEKWNLMDLDGFGIQRIRVIRSELLQVAIRGQPLSLPAVCQQHYARVAEI